MKLGAFVMPSHPPERPLIEGSTGISSSSSEPDSVLDVDDLIEHNWFVRSPGTVTETIAALQTETGGFGGMLITMYDSSQEQAEWDESLDLLVKEVAPRFPDASSAP